MDWFLYDRDLRHERVKKSFDSFQTKVPFPYPLKNSECPNTEFFLVRTGKYGPEKTPHLDTFHAVSDISRRLWGKKLV